MVLPVKDCIPKSTTSGLDTVAVRCPKTAVTRALIAQAGVPIAAPSANISGKPSTTTAAHVLHDYGTEGKIDAIIDGGPCEVGVESTIVDLTGARPRLLRPGGVTPEELSALLGELEIDKAVLGQIANDTVVRAPGMKYKHYAPRAEVYIITGTSEAAATYVRRHFTQGDAVLCFEEELPLYEGCNPTAYGKNRRCKKPFGGSVLGTARLGSPGNQDDLRSLSGGRRRRLCGQQPSEKGCCFPLRQRGGRSMTVIGITGGTGSGKTTLLDAVKAQGGLCIDCDALYHELLDTDEVLLSQLSAEFPAAFDNGVLNRKSLGNLVFADKAALAALNEITHRVVCREVRKIISKTKRTLVAIEAIALCESGLNELCDVTVAVTAPEEIRIGRLMERDGISRDYAKKTHPSTEIGCRVFPQCRNIR